MYELSGITTARKCGVKIRVKTSVPWLGHTSVRSPLKVSSLTLFRKWSKFFLFSEMLPPETDFQRGKMSWKSLEFKTVKVDFIPDNRKLWLRFTFPKQCEWNIKTTSWNIQTVGTGHGNILISTCESLTCPHTDLLLEAVAKISEAG